MPEPSGPEPDRRRHVRIEPKGSVSIHAAGDVVAARLVNIGAGGVYLATDVAASDRLLGSVVELELRFDGALSAWQWITGRVSRLDAKGLAVVFDAPTGPVLLDMIDELATASHASKRVLSVVLIDADKMRRTAIAAGFRAAGCEVVDVGTQLDAVVRLGESHFEPDIIAVANSQPTTNADEMRTFIRRDHSRAMLVAIGPELLDPTGRANWLSSSTSAADLPARIRELIFAPRA
jgi:hypothetical protein